MWLPIVLLLLITCQTSISIGIYNEEHAGFRPGLTHAEFGERLRDWFRNLKDRLLGRKMESSDSSERDVMNLDRADLQDRVRNSGGFFVDLSKIAFDPKYDIGFRIGRWYFIRTGDRIENEFGYNDSREWDMSSSLGPDQFTHKIPNYDWLNDDYNKMFETTFLPSTTERALMTEQTIMESDELESGSTELPKREEDNETGAELDSNSAQVIFPS